MKPLGLLCSEEPQEGGTYVGNLHEILTKQIDVHNQSKERVLTLNLLLIFTVPLQIAQFGCRVNFGSNMYRDHSNVL